MSGKKILVIDDELRMRRILQLMLEEEQFEVSTAEHGHAGIKMWKKFEPDVVLTDIKMPVMDGMSVLDFKNRHFPKTPLVILTAFGTIEKAVAAMKQGAFDYLTKPFRNRDVVKVIQSALKSVGPRSDQVAQAQKIVGCSDAVNKIFDEMAIVANTRTSVLITGDSGTGKELVARTIHQSGSRSKKPIVKVNCSAIPAELLESELFGHVKGSFTGAVSDREGSFQKADQGVLFLDEIGDLPMHLQPKLLHAVEDKTVTPVGASNSQQVDVKIISASNRNLEGMIASGEFRKDLYFRLNTFKIQIPRLKKRLEDIDELVPFFLENFKLEFDKPGLRILPEAVQLMKTYDWPGNVRELKNVMERVILTCRTDEITPADLTRSFDMFSSLSNGGLSPTSLDLEAREKQTILTALEKTGGNQVQAAKLLNISRNTLRYRMKKFNLMPSFTDL